MVKIHQNANGIKGFEGRERGTMMETPKRGWACEEEGSDEPFVNEGGCKQECSLNGGANNNLVQSYFS